MKTSQSLAETQNFAAELVDILVKNPTSNGAIVVGMYGDLGSGKTSFVQGIAKALGVEAQVASPTFVLEKIYKLDNTKQSRFKHLVHIDAYRMESTDELMHIGWHDLIADPDNLIFIEWPEKVAPSMPQGHVEVHAKFVDQNVRTFDIKIPNN